MKTAPHIAPRMTKREFLLGAAGAGVTGLSLLHAPQPYMPMINSEAFDALMPQEFGGWTYAKTSGLVLPPPDSLRDRLYDSLVTRIYTHPSKPMVMMVLAYKNVQDGIVQVHRPEVCYPASGFTLDGGHDVMLHMRRKNVPGKVFTARLRERIEQVLYFTRIGQDFPLSWAEQRISVLEANVRGAIPDGMLSRVSMIHPDRQYAVNELSSFFGYLADAGGAKLRRLLLGSH